VKLLVCVSEYHPYGSGIARMVYNLLAQFKQMGIKYTICSPVGPDIKLGNYALIQRFGRLGLLWYWDKVRAHLRNWNSHYELVWLHQPLFIRKTFLRRALITIHITSRGVFRSVKQSDGYPLSKKMYKGICAYIERFCLRRLRLEKSAFSTVSLQVYDEVLSLGIINENDIKYIPNGVDTRFFRPISKEKKVRLRAYFGIPKCDTVLLSVGSLTVIKNPLRLLEIYSLVEHELKNICLVMVGKGELEGKIKKLAKELKIKKLIFLGHIEYEKIPNVYACSDVYVLTSVYEGFPLTLLEAMSSGLPCIVSNVPSLRSIVNDAKAGVVVDINDKIQAVSQVIDFLSNKERLLRCGENARQFMVRNFDWRKIAKIYVQQFYQIMNREVRARR